jgi:hypothetical protein
MSAPQLVGYLEELAFAECDTCRALPGTPPLCMGCLHNRAVISALLEATDPKLNGARTRAAKILAGNRQVRR